MIALSVLEVDNESIDVLNSDGLETRWETRRASVVYLRKIILYAELVGIVLII